MKTTKLALLGCCLAMTMSASALATTIAGWTFETSIPTTAGPHAAEVGSGSASGVHASASTVYSNPAGNGSAESFSSNFWGVSDYYQFTTSTTAYVDLSLTFDVTSSNTGPRDFKVETSTDGTTFSDLINYTVLANAAPNPVWNTTTASPIYTVTASLPAALENQASIFVRLTNTSTVSANGGTVATAGSNRIDNVLIDGTIIPEPSTVALMFVSLGAMLIRRK